MAAVYTHDEDERAFRRAQMVALRKRGLSYGQIARKFHVGKNSVRIIVLKACNQTDPKRKHQNGTN